MNFDWESLAGGVYRCRLPFLDVTIGLIHGPTGVLLIDCGTTIVEATSIAADVAELTGSQVSDVVLTHHHFDHVLGSGAFGSSRIFAAAPVAAAVGDPKELADDAVHHGADRQEVDRAVTSLRTPDRIVTTARIDLGDRIVAIEHPGRGHTHHDLVVVAPPRDPGDVTVVFCGDLIEESADPAVDAGSDLAAWPDTIGRLRVLGGPDARYVPGHGGVVDADFLVRQQQWLAGSAAGGLRS